MRAADGTVTRIVGVAKDITEGKRLEQHYRQAQKMEAIGTLAGGIAHDFNNILSAITGYTELAKAASAGNAPALEHLAAVSVAGWRAKDLVRQILAFSRQHTEERQPLQLRHIVAESLKLLRATIPSTIEFKATLARDVPPVRANATQINQIVMNLCTNAWHAMTYGAGVLTVKLDAVEIDQAMIHHQPQLCPGRYVRLSIGDTGHGIDPAIVNRIFEPFFTTKAPGEGTGLGLSVVHGIMQSHAGVVTVESKPGQGTTFDLYFPALTGEVPEVAVPIAPTLRGQGERILFVDDEGYLAQLGQKILTMMGYTVEMRTSASEALELIRAEPRRFDLVLTDQTMPGMTGLDFAERVTRFCPELPIILTTGHATDLSKARGRPLGIQEILLKPYTVQDLGAITHRVLAQRKTS